MRPFKTLTSKLVSFTKSIIFPVITYVAGAYSSNLVQLNLGNTIGYSVAIIAVSAIIYVVWIFISSILRRLIFRDYDIALALYEDLQDIKLIYFTGSCAPTNEYIHTTICIHCIVNLFSLFIAAQFCAVRGWWILQKKQLDNCVASGYNHADKTASRRSAKVAEICKKRF